MGWLCVGVHGRIIKLCGQASGSLRDPNAGFGVISKEGCCYYVFVWVLKINFLSVDVFNIHNNPDGYVCILRSLRSAGSISEALEGLIKEHQIRLWHWTVHVYELGYFLSELSVNELPVYCDELFITGNGYV